MYKNIGIPLIGGDTAYGPMTVKKNRSHRNISLAKGNIPSTISAPEFHKHDSQF